MYSLLIDAVIYKVENRGTVWAKQQTKVALFITEDFSK